MSDLQASRGASLLLALGLTLGMATLDASPAVAQETSGAQLAAAMQEVIAKAIATSERSVVAIAAVRRDTREHDDQALNPFNQLQLFVAPQPGDADFIPNEYATGVVVDAGGLILTANHVVRDDCDYWITTPERKTYRVTKIVGADPRSDLAVLSIEASDLVPIKLGDGSHLKKGQIVVALGNPYSIARDGQLSATWGIVSNLERKDRPWLLQQWASEHEPPLAKPTLHHYGTLIETDARLPRGTSGGALLNLQGEMIGLTMTLSSGMGYEQPHGFALPVDETFLRALDTLKQGREVEYGFLGIKPASLSREVRLRGKHGVLVQDLVEGTPAERAGLVRNDLITHIDDQPIFERDDLMLHIGKLAADASVRLTVERDGSPRVVTVQELSKYPLTGRKIVSNPVLPWRGLRVDYVTASRDFQLWVVQRRLDLQGSVVITEVEENSPAWQEGLRPNMMISHVGSKRVTTPKAFQEAVAGQVGPVKLRLTLPANDQPVRTILPLATSSAG
ncbi:MAG TPA: trypsin-like peptidase domain-containing protein [Pirellulales bacterium]|nr:trypsin-like peptidase domain-containing protein [Pirellulales bacterium]